MTFEFTETTQVHTIFFVACGDRDLLAAVCRPAKEWVTRWRFRYYSDDKVWDSEDRKSWYEARGSGNPAVMVEAFRQIAVITAATFGGVVHEAVVDGTGIEAIEVLKAAPWAHCLTHAGQA